jgi:hypothetical protein
MPASIDSEIILGPRRGTPLEISRGLGGEEILRDADHKLRIQFGDPGGVVPASSDHRGVMIFAPGDPVLDSDYQLGDVHIWIS